MEDRTMGKNRDRCSNRAIWCARACGAVAAAIISCGSVMGTTYTWSGLSIAQPPFFIPSPAWSNPFNWYAPGIPVSAADTELVFGPAAFPLPLQDLAEPFVLRTLSFPAGGGGYLLQGGTLSLEGLAPTISQ